MRKKISVFLVLVFMLAILPQASMYVQAKDVVRWHDLSTESSISVEKGAKFYIGDYVIVTAKNSHATASMTGASYKSLDTKIATVSNKGLVKAKKEGMTNITVTCKGKKLTCQLVVEEKGTYEKSTEAKELKKAVQTLAKGMPGKTLNAGKAYNFITKYRKFMSNYNLNSKTKLSYDGFIFNNEKPASDSVDVSKSDKLAVPEASRYWTAYALVRQFQLTNDPTSIESKNTMKISSVAVNSKSDKITVKLTKNVTEAQILAAQLAFPKQNVAASSRKTADITVPVYDENSKTYYKGKATLKKGNKQVTIQPTYYRGLQYHNADLLKGHTYRIGSELDWGNGKKANAK
ncbi:MAG: Ig-like domain-containing protein [Lachnospiraceae bacterium]|nr:Ig-like domain-containing protein [Lachnospiraceae bacterium]